MQRTRIVVVLIIVFAFLAGFAAGQRKVPTENAGQSEQELRSLDLTNELDSSKGRPLDFTITWIGRPSPICCKDR